MLSNPSDQARAGTHTLAEALAISEEAKKAVEEVAHELGVVYEVLVSEVAQLASEGDGPAAVQRTAVLARKLSETAHKITEVNEALANQKASLEHLSSIQ